MNVIDIVVLVVCLLFFADGCRRGLIRSFGSLLAVVLGLWAASRLGGLVSPYLIEWLGDGRWIPVLSFVVVFLLALVVVSLLARLVERLIQAVSLGWINRLLGGGFALLIGIFVLSVAINVYDWLDRDHKLLGQEKVANSLTYRPVSKVAPAVFPSLDFEKWKKPFTQLTQKEEA